MARDLSSPFQLFPFDIAQHIFEHAARSNADSRWSLSVVSRSVQRWTDPIVFQTIVITKIYHAERFLGMFDHEDGSPRLIQILSFVRKLISDVYGVHPPWNQIVRLFPNLVALRLRGDRHDFQEGIEDPAAFQPALLPTLRRLGGGYGSRTIRGSWACVQMITHLDLTELSTWSWSDLNERGLKSFTSLTHLSCELSRPYSFHSFREDFLVLYQLLPPSLLICLVHIPHILHLRQQECDTLSHFAYKLDDRLLMCTDYELNMDPEWVLRKVDVKYDLGEWLEERNERDSYWTRGLDMVIRRRQVLSALWE